MPAPVSIIIGERGGTAMVATRRQLRFASLGQVMPDVERLLAGHATIGRWSLGQVLNHLGLTIRLSMDEAPEKFSWPVRRLFGPVARQLSFWLGWIPAGLRVPEVYLPPPGSDAAREAAGLRAAIERLGVFAGQFDEHPLLGRLSAAQWERFHCLHCAHHLSFALPVGREAATPGGGPGGAHQLERIRRSGDGLSDRSDEFPGTVVALSHSG